MLDSESMAADSNNRSFRFYAVVEVEVDFLVDATSPTEARRRAWEEVSKRQGEHGFVMDVVNMSLSEINPDTGKGLAWGTEDEDGELVSED